MKSRSCDAGHCPIPSPRGSGERARERGPESTPRPFDRRRDGLVVGEGGGCLILEEYEHARKRGANICAEIIGYGQGCNSTHPTNSDPEGICIAVNAALRDAELAPSDIQHIALAAPTAGGMVES